jgi:uncharacterized protein YegL
VVGGASNLGKAYTLLDSLIAPDGRALVYLFTDGEPTDDWDEALKTLRDGKHGKDGKDSKDIQNSKIQDSKEGRVRRIIGLACGPMIRAEAVRPYCDEAYALGNQTPDSLFNMIRGLS